MYFYKYLLSNIRLELYYIVLIADLVERETGDDGTMGRRDDGTKGRWDRETMGRWDDGTKGRWGEETMGQKHEETGGRWNDGTKRWGEEVC